MSHNHSAELRRNVRFHIAARLSPWLLLVAFFPFHASGIDPCGEFEEPVYTYSEEGTKIAQTFFVEEPGTLDSFFFFFPCEDDIFYGDMLGRIRIVETEDGIPIDSEIARINLEPGVSSFLDLFFTPVYLEGHKTYAIELEIFDLLPEWGLRFGISTENSNPSGAMWVMSDGGEWEPPSVQGAVGENVDLLMELSIAPGSPVILSVTPERDAPVEVNKPMIVTVEIGPEHQESVERVTISIGDESTTLTEAPYEFQYTPTAIGSVRLGVNVRLSDGRNPSTSYNIYVDYAPPENDNFEDAINVSGSLIEISTSNSGATREFGEVRFGENQGEHSIWYEWTAPFDGICVLDGNGIGWQQQALLFTVYSGDSLEDSIVVISNGSDGPGEIIEFQVFEGSTYLVSVDSYIDENFGNLTWSLRLRSENDLFENRTYFQADRVSLIGNNIGSSKEVSEPGPQNGRSVWFSWQPSVSSETEISITSNSLDYWLAVYEGDELRSLTLVESLQGSSGSVQKLVFDADSKAVYSIQIASVDGKEGEFQLSIDQNTIRIINPGSDSLVTFGNPVTIQALPFNDSEKISEVRFYANGELLGIANQTPYIHEWSDAALGSYLLHVESVLNDGTILNSPPVSVLIHEQNELPEPKIFTGGFRYPEVYVIDATGTTFHWGGLITRRDYTIPPSDPFATDWRLIPVSTYYRHFLPQRTNFPFDSTRIRKIIWSNNYSYRDKEAWVLSDDGRLIRRVLPEILPTDVNEVQEFAEYLVAGESPEVAYFKSNYQNNDLFDPFYYTTQEWTERLIADFCSSISDNVIYGSNIYNSDELQSFDLSPATRKAIADDYDISLINRHILSDLFPEYIMPFSQWNEVPKFPDAERWVDVCQSDRSIYALDDLNRIFRFPERGSISEMNMSDSHLRIEAIAGLNDGIVTVRENGQMFFHAFPASWSTEFETSEITFADSHIWKKLEATRNGRILALSEKGKLFEVIEGIAHEVLPPDGSAGWSDVTAGGLHVLAIASSGQLYSWGFNEFGQLGNGLNFAEYQNQPSLVPLPPGVNAWMAIAASETHSMAIGDDCRLYTWGGNESGVLGVGTYPDRLSPKAVLSVNSLCGIPVMFTDSERSVLPDGRFMVEFRSDLNRSYTIQYGDDAETWESSFPPILGNGELVQWIDEGPPVTKSLPSENASRIYRVIFTP